MKNLPKLGLGKIGILILAGLCLGVFIYDMATNGLKGSLNAEAPVAGLTLNPTVIPEPQEGAFSAQSAAPSNAAAQKDSADDDAFYAEYRLEREQVRAGELELLQSVIDDDNASQELRDKANERKLQIAQNMEYELMTERVLLAKDFGETVVMMGKGTVTVVLSGPFDELAAAQVAEAVSGVTGAGYEDIIIINR